MTDKMKTSPGEVFLLTFFVPASSLLLQLIPISHKLSACLEAVTLNMILLLCVTLWSDCLLHLLIVYIVVLIILFYLAFKRFTFREITLKLKYMNQAPLKEKEFNKAFIGDYRGHLLLATSICILAVDFPIFPSKFAKTETFGWSVMDAGVGSFIILNGLCSSHGKHISENGLKRCFKSSFPLVLLGFLRLYLTTSVGYHKVVSEYGIHWNFFFTLAFTKVICYSMLSKLNVKPGILAITAVITYQVCLTKLKLSDFVMSPERRNLLEANKEGIVSLPGFISLYFFGVQMGHTIWKRRERMWDYCFLMLKLCSIGLCCWCLMFIFHEKCQHVSRRMANLSYCIWIISLTSLQISVHLCYRLTIVVLKNLLRIPSHQNFLWNVLNYNGLLYFLFANLLTGLVNVTINVADSSNLKSLCILILYLVTLFSSSFILYKYNIKL